MGHRLLMGLLAALLGCAGSPSLGSNAVGHAVAFSTAGPAVARELSLDLEVLLDETPGVLEARVGPRADVAVRPGVTDTGFDVLLWVSFTDRASLLAYLESPAHQALVQRYEPSLTRVRVFDAWIGR